MNAMTPATDSETHYFWAVGRDFAADNPNVTKAIHAEVLAAHLRTIRWRSATAADRDLLQAPFRAGIRLDAYQLLPLRKALRLPRVNLLIADDVGLGKTIEAGLVLDELHTRGLVRSALILVPPSLIEQWQGEMRRKFSLDLIHPAAKDDPDEVRKAIEWTGAIAGDD